MNWGKPFGRTWTYVLGAVSTAYATMAGAWAALPRDWVPTLNEPERWVLASIGVLLAGSVVMAHKIESAPRPPVPIGNDFHQGDSP